MSGNKNWIISVTPKTWQAVEGSNAYATKTRVEPARIRKGDRMAFYVRGTGMFNCICRAETGWHEPSSYIWLHKQQHVTDEIDVSRVVTGVAGVRGLARSLQFAKRRTWIGLHLHGGLANYGRPITDKDLGMISDRMRQSPRLSV